MPRPVTTGDTRQRWTVQGGPGTGQVVPRSNPVPVPGGNPDPRVITPRPTDPPYPGWLNGNSGTGPDRRSPTQGGGWVGGGTPTPGTNPGPTFGQGMLPAVERDVNSFATSPNQIGATPFWQSPGILSASQDVVGSNVANNPAVAAAVNDFNLNTAPTIENQMALSGLGRTSATANALARAQAQMLTPLYQQALDLENQRLGRQSGAVESELGRRDAAQQREAQALQTQASMLLGYGQTQTDRLNSAIQTAMANGATERDIRQQYGDAAYNDFMRRQALSEESTFGPFGNTIGSMFGSTVRQSK